MDKLSESEIFFWNNFKNEALSDINFLLKNKKDHIALKNILCAIDVLAGLFVGREKNVVEESWFSYIDRVMGECKKINLKKMGLHFPNLKIPSFHRNERERKFKRKKDIENCCALLYPVYRTSAIHNGVLPESFFITRESASSNVWIVNKSKSGYKIGLNILELFDALKKSMNRFEKSFKNDPNRIKNFRKRYNFVKSSYLIEKINSEFAK